MYMQSLPLLEFGLISLVALTIALARAVLRVDSDGITMSIRILGWRVYRKSIPAALIDQLKNIASRDDALEVSLINIPVTYRILGRSPHRTMFMWFGKGIYILSGKSHFLIGSENPPSLIAAIESLRSPIS